MHRTSTYLAAVGVWAALHIAGCVDAVPPEAMMLLQEGKQALARDEAEQARQKMDVLLARHGRTRLAAEAYCTRGQARRRLGDLDGARADLSRACSLADEPAVRAASLVALGDLSVQTGDLPAAESAYRQALDSAEPGQPPADHVLLELGCVLQRQGRWVEADLQFDRLIYLFEGGPEADQAASKVRCRAWTIQAGRYDDRAAAQQAARDLQDRKVDAAVRVVRHGDGLAYAVQVGSFPTYAQAAAALGGLKAPLDRASIVQTR